MFGEQKYALNYLLRQAAATTIIQVYKKRQIEFQVSTFSERRQSSEAHR